MKNFHPGEKAGMAGEGGKSFDQLTDNKQREPRRKRMIAGKPCIKAFAIQK